MKLIKIAKASPCYEGGTIEDVTIQVSEDIPTHYENEKEKYLGDYYRDQANQIADALYLSLPQGTFDRLIMELMGKRISTYQGLTGNSL